MLVTMAAIPFCLAPVDYQPYVVADYHKATERESLTNRMEATVRGRLDAGFGRRKLTPTLKPGSPENPVEGVFREMPLAGYGERRGRSVTGVHDDVWVKAIALRVEGRTAVFVGADALIIPREVGSSVVERARREFGLEREWVYMGATHTHSSLGGWGEGMVNEIFAGPFNPGVRVWIAECMVGAIRDALTNLQPAVVGCGHFSAREYVRNRFLGAAGEVDPDFSFMSVRQSQGGSALLGAFAAHATSVSAKNMEFSGDYPGAWQRGAEEALDNGFAMFLAGAVGSHSPVAPKQGLAGPEGMAKGLSDALSQALPQVQMTNFVELSAAGIDLHLPPLHVRLSDGVRLRPWLAKRLVPAPERSFVQALRVNGFVWISTPCDFSGELALGVKDHLRARGFDGAVTSFNGDYIGYVIPAKYYHLGGYEPRTMSFYGPNTADYLGAWIRQLTARVTASE
jgi:hypothetical protein